MTIVLRLVTVGGEGYWRIKLLQDYLLDEGCGQPYPFTHEALADYGLCEPEAEVSVGIGVVAERGDMVIMGTDMRGTFPRLATAHEECAKAYLMPPPILCGVAVAGTLRVAQPFVDFLAFYLERLAKRRGTRKSQSSEKKSKTL